MVSGGTPGAGLTRSVPLWLCTWFSSAPLLPLSGPLPGSGPLLARLGSVGAHTLKFTSPRPLPLRPCDLAHH